MEQLAPIALFAFNRLPHTLQTVQALQRNELASASTLFIFSDGPRTQSDVEKVRAVREYLRSVTGFGKVTLVERGENLGLAQSIMTGVTEIVNRYGRIIVLEDDMVTSRYFLRFMNEALELYRDEERVVSIHGYIYPMAARLPETFFLKDTGCWGWATWKRGWALFEPDGKKLLSELEGRKLTRKFDIDGSYPFTQMLRDQISGKNNSWAIRWQASAFLRGKLTLFPGRSLVRNIGHDSSGVHCTQTGDFDVEATLAPVPVGNVAIEESSFVTTQLGKYFRSIRQSTLQKFLFAARSPVAALSTLARRYRERS